ncbi:HTH DNA binding protein [Mycobacterium phage Twister]|uniref:HTH DNA binding domain protein n=1 Tax=Mycobacterium phage Twister TaxID=1161933 RepID=H9NCQ3_9CAUD|nr:HTH DNA binding protein [Mycobacterium phage Twister]AFF28374.1 HTH DNA binding domain protein [Mycobacterium phage Twister]
MADTNTIQVTPAAIAKAIDDLLEENERLRAENATLRGTQARASDLFGEAFVKGGQLPPPKGPNRPNAPKLSRRDAEHIRDLVRAGNSRREVARAYDINPATVSRIVRGTYYR